MEKIQIYENSCCGPSDQGEKLAKFLENKFTVGVEVYDVGRTESVRMTPTLINIIQKEGQSCFPLLMVDDIVLTKGWLPNFLQAVSIVDKGEYTAGTQKINKCC